jgi:hypothetical protein
MKPAGRLDLPTWRTQVTVVYEHDKERFVGPTDCGVRDWGRYAEPASRRSRGEVGRGGVCGGVPGRFALRPCARLSAFLHQTIRSSIPTGCPSQDPRPFLTKICHLLGGGESGGRTRGRERWLVLTMTYVGGMGSAGPGTAKPTKSQYFVGERRQGESETDRQRLAGCTYAYAHSKQPAATQPADVRKRSGPTGERSTC